MNKFKCNKCHDTGITWHYHGNGAHFGGSIRDEIREYYCKCEKGKEKEKAKVKLGTTYV